MQIQKINFDDFKKALNSSIAAGKANYLVFFVGAVISAAVEKVLGLASIGSLFFMVFFAFWQGGEAFVSQTVIEKKKVPKVVQFFGAFYKTSLLKRLVPSLIVSLVISMLFLVVLGAVGLIFVQYIKVSTPENTVLMGQLIGVSTIVGLLLLSLAQLPIMFFPLILVFQKLNWRESLRLSVNGALKSFPIVFLFFIPSAIVQIIALIEVLLSPYYALALSESAVFKMVLTGIPYVIKVVFIFLQPFFMTLVYSVYKGIFHFDLPDSDLELAE